MPSDLAQTHRQGQKHIMDALTKGIAAIWTSLGFYSEQNVPTFMRQALPLVNAAQVHSSALVAAYIARFLGAPAFGIAPALVTGAAVRNGTEPRDVYLRAFHNVWRDLGEGKSVDDAVNAGKARVQGAAAMDVALTQRQSFQIAQERFQPGATRPERSALVTEHRSIYGFQRVASPTACDYCRKVTGAGSTLAKQSTIEGAYVKFASAMPLHVHCGCSLEPLTRPHPLSRYLPSGEKLKTLGVANHDELGPILVNPDDHFTPMGAH